MAKTCFVISPIGEEGSATRKHADDVFDLIIKPAVEKYGFDVVRADKIAGAKSITEDVIRLVQESALCIADLTGHNPNVFYECGRRHETGKPTIQIISKEEKRIPFDLAGIRTIKYDMSDLREARKAILTIQDFIDEAASSGFEEQSSGTSMATINDALIRIERKLTKLSSTTSNEAISKRNKVGFDLLRQNPQAALKEAIINGDIETILTLLPRLRNILGKSSLIQVAGILSMQGYPEGKDILLDVVSDFDEEEDIDIYRAAISALNQYYIARDEEKEGTGTITPLIQNIIAFEGVSDESKAYFYNQLGMIQNGAGQLSEALDSLQNALRYAPQEPSYHYNISIVFQKSGLSKQAVEHARKSLDYESTPDEDHLSHAYEVFKENNLEEEAEDALQKLRAVNAGRAAYAEL